METINTMQAAGAAARKSGILYPTMLIAAIAVIIFSVLGIAAMMGYLPSAMSRNGPDARNETAAKSEAATVPEAKPGTRRLAAAAAAGCADCGVVESIRAVETKGQGSGLGAVAGGILGNQLGGGSGHTALTLVGAGAGAYAGHEIEQGMNKTVSYQVKVRMKDGTRRTFYERAQPALAVGQKVRVTNHDLDAAGWPRESAGETSRPRANGQGRWV
jgi:outer membrane lipoprotein SlyB